MTKHLFRTTLSLFAITALVFATMGADSCKVKSGDYVSYVKTGVRVLGKAKTIFAANGLSTEKFDPAIKVGNAAVAALEANAIDAVDLIANFIDAFEGIAADADFIKDPKTRTIVLVSLIAGSEALHTLSESMNRSASNDPAIASAAAVRSESAQKISAYAAKPRWRCRNSITGQFAKMGYCEKNPSTSVVERY